MLMHRYFRYFRLSIWGCQNVSKKILLTLSKFHEKCSGRSGDIKNFHIRGEGSAGHSPHSTEEGLKVSVYIYEFRIFTK